MTNPRAVFQSWGKRVCRDCTVGFLLQYFGFSLYSQKLFPCPISSLSLLTWNLAVVQLSMTSAIGIASQWIWPTPWISLLWKISMSWHSVSIGSWNKPLPSDFICMKNSMKFSFDSSPWETDYRPRFSWTNLSSCKLLSAVGMFLVVSLLLLFLPLNNSIRTRPCIWDGLRELH